jgi:hypothetical protein
MRECIQSGVHGVHGVYGRMAEMGVTWIQMVWAFLSSSLRSPSIGPVIRGGGKRQPFHVNGRVRSHLRTSYPLLNGKLHGCQSEQGAWNFPRPPCISIVRQAARQAAVTDKLNSRHVSDKSLYCGSRLLSRPGPICRHAHCIRSVLTKRMNSHLLVLYIISRVG